MLRVKAICFGAYGPPDVLEMRDLPSPIPAADEVLVRVHAATVTPGDCETRDSRFPWWIWLPLRLYLGLFKPRHVVLGMEFSGVVESVGGDVERLKVGDPIFAATGLPFGTYAEYRCQRVSSAIARKPDGVSHAQAATIGVGAMNALHYLRLGKVAHGDRLLINGAAGCFGTYAVQLAKAMGAEVTAVDRGDKLGILRELGADHVIDYIRHDFTAGGIRYDVILEISGKASYSRCLETLERNGRLVLANPRLPQMLRAPVSSLLGARKVSFAFCRDRAEDLEYLAGLMAAGRLRAVIDRRYALEQVAEAHRYVESGAKVGHVVIDIAH